MVAHGVFFKDLEKFLPTPNQNVNITDEIDPKKKIIRQMCSFIGGGNRSTGKKPPTYRKSLTNIIT
jgi:hypothetical protein